MFDALRSRLAGRAHRRAMIAHQGELACWEEADARIDRMLEIVRDCAEGRTDAQFTDRSDYGFLLDNDEFGVAHITGSVLVQVVREPGRYSGGYGGVSFPVFGGVRAHSGGGRGRFMPGKESLTVVDEGITFVTSKRIMFRGSLNSQEWRFTAMMAMEHHAEGFTTIHMAESGKPMAIGYGNRDGSAVEVHFRLEIAAALARDSVARFLAELEAEKAHHASLRPVPPGSPGS